MSHQTKKIDLPTKSGHQTKFDLKIIMNKINQSEYEKHFLQFNKHHKIQENAFNEAKEIRKFEIELYWKRAAHFWTFIGVAFAAYGLVQRVDSPERVFLSISISCLGLVFSYAWFCVNRGSKYWQENWENHVSLLEDNLVGPLYKTILSRNDEQKKINKDTIKSFIVGPYPYSVSKINQIISLFVTIFWSFLIFHSTPIYWDISKIEWNYVTPIALALVTCVAISKFGQTDVCDHYHKAIQYKSEIGHE